MKVKNTKEGMHINLFLEGRRCLIIGGGKVAFHKTELLLEAQACVHVISPKLCDELKRLYKLKLITIEQREFQDEDAHNATLVYAATDSRGANKSILSACRKKKYFMLLCRWKLAGRRLYDTSNYKT